MNVDQNHKIQSKLKTYNFLSTGTLDQDPVTNSLECYTGFINKKKKRVNKKVVKFKFSHHPW